jgi:alpha-tubulin suppressor-like RCC1 family protein
MGAHDRRGVPPGFWRPEHKSSGSADRGDAPERAPHEVGGIGPGHRRSRFLARSGSIVSALLLITAGAIAWLPVQAAAAASNPPVPIQVTVGATHTCALMDTGAVECWGGNSLGQLGDGILVDRSSPTRVPDLPRATEIAAGDNFTCALTTSGAVWCWGLGISYGPGDRTTSNWWDVPNPIPGVGSGVTSVSAGGETACAILASGAVECWGDNTSGQIGDGTTNYANVPVSVVGLPAAAAEISSGYQHTCVVTVNGAALCWGNNSFGQLGDGSATNSSTPVAVESLQSGVTSITASGDNTCAITTTGGAKCWGGYSGGQLGSVPDPPLTCPISPLQGAQATPIDVPGVSSVVALAGGLAHQGLAVQVGVGSSSPCDGEAYPVVASFECALASGGSVMCWGDNTPFGQLGRSTGSSADGAPGVVPGLDAGVTSIATGSGDHECAIQGTSVWCWGRDSNGQVGVSPELSVPPTSVTSSWVTTPDLPTGVSATSSIGEATVSWVPAGAEGSAVISYTATAHDQTSPGANGDGTTCTYIVITPEVDSCSFSGITAGDSYTFTVSATNSIGTGSASEPSNPAVPLGPPSAPTQVIASVGLSAVRLTWAGPTSDGGSPVTGAVVRYSSDGGLSWTSPDSCSSVWESCLVTGLTGGTTYTFEVAWVNSVGTGSFSQGLSATPSGPPSAPSGVSAASGNGTVSLSWTAPSSNGGLAITGYAVSYSPNSGTTWSTATSDTASTSTSYTVTGLTNGTAYVFDVAAINAAGTGSYSTTSTAVTPSTVPGAPTGATATAGSSQASVTWTAPASTGGSAITGYTVTSTPGSLSCTTATTACTVTGLTNGTAYAFAVVATNADGTGLASAPSTSIIVGETPAITSSSTASFTTGTAGSFAVTTAGTPVPALSEAGTLPGGLSFHDNGNGTATLSGTPGVGGTSSISITATNGVGANATQTLSISVVTPTPTSLSITTASLPAGSLYTKTHKVLYSATLAAVAGNAPYKWTLGSGALPTGLKLKSTGVISGKATVAGTFTFTVQVIDTKTKIKPHVQHTATKVLSITVS